jgi:hypothetical protein
MGASRIGAQRGRYYRSSFVEGAPSASKRSDVRYFDSNAVNASGSTGFVK